jgi:co-chaperonin GroES (HSP10)
MSSLLRMKHEKDPRIDLLESVGDISQFNLFNNQVLVAIYIRPERTSGGILIPGATRDEDKWQGKVGLVLKKGPSAFLDPDGKWFNGEDVDPLQWVVFRPSDGWQLKINDAHCRIVDDVNIRGVIPHPDLVW